MKKRLTVILILFVAVSIVTGLFYNINKEPDKVNLSELNVSKFQNFQGTWECEENPLNDPDNYTGYIMMKIDKGGDFRIYDGDSGITFIQGAIAISGNDHLVMRCNPDSVFNPPNTWDTMDKIEQIKYKFKSEEKLYLTYEETKRIRSTLIFSKKG